MEVKNVYIFPDLYRLCHVMTPFWLCSSSCQMQGTAASNDPKMAFQSSSNKPDFSGLQVSSYDSLFYLASLEAAVLSISVLPDTNIFQDTNVRHRQVCDDSISVTHTCKQSLYFKTTLTSFLEWQRAFSPLFTIKSYVSHRAR